MEYVIIGNGVAGITAAFTIRERDPQARITVISGESDFFFSRTALMYAFLDRMNLRDLEPYERSVYGAKRIHRVKAWVRDLDASNRTITLDTGEQIRYDRLLIATGSSPNRAAWPGLEQIQKGSATFVTLQDLAKCEQLTPSTKQAVVVGGGLIGFELVECLAYHGVQVTFLVREPWYWPAALAKPEGEMVTEHIRRHGVDVRVGEQVSAVSADSSGRVSAVQTDTGQEIPCQLLGVCIGVHPHVEWLGRVSTPPLIRRGVAVSPDFKTSLESVFAAGDCAEIEWPDSTRLVEQIWYSAKRQGELAARSMLGDAVHYRSPIFFNSAKFFEIEYTTVGQFNPAAGRSEGFYWRAPGREASIRILDDNGTVAGFNMLGSRWDHRILERWISERRPLDLVVRDLHSVQFDVEFGRLDLRPLRAAFETWRNGQLALPGGRG